MAHGRGRLGRRATVTTRRLDLPWIAAHISDIASVPESATGTPTRPGSFEDGWSSEQCHGVGGGAGEEVWPTVVDVVDEEAVHLVRREKSPDCVGRQPRGFADDARPGRGEGGAPCRQAAEDTRGFRHHGHE